MARPYIPEEASTYYPPRARWYSFIFSLGDHLRRWLAMDRIRLPREMKAGAVVAGFFVPGLAVWLRGPRVWGHMAMLAGSVLMLVFVIWLGYPLANFAFGLLLSMHCSGFVYYCNPVLVREPFLQRLRFTVLILIGLGLVVYLPARTYIQGHWLTPLRMNGHVIVVQRSFPTSHIQRGDWVAYTMDENAVGENYHGGTVWLQHGVSLGPVLGLAGDQVVFSTNSFSVNGIWHTNLPHMPQAGELVVPENHWFIWPNLGISGHGDVGEARISSALLGLSSVDNTHFDFFGRPFHRWFWREQKLP